MNTNWLHLRLRKSLNTNVYSTAEKIVRAVFPEYTFVNLGNLPLPKKLVKMKNHIARLLNDDFSTYKAYQSLGVKQKETILEQLGYHFRFNSNRRRITQSVLDNFKGLVDACVEANTKSQRVEYFFV